METAKTPDRRRRRWRQFSLRTMILLVTIVSIACSFVTARMRAAKRQEAAVKAIKEAGGLVTYDYFLDNRPHGKKGAQPPGPEWLRDRLGIDFFARVVEVRLHRFGQEKVVAKHLTAMPRLRLLNLRGVANLSDSDLARIGQLQHLEQLQLSSPKISDVLLSRISHPKRMKILVLEDTRITDVGAERLRAFSNLEELGLAGSRITDAALVNLTSMKKLRILRIEGTAITNSGLEHLAHLDKLEYVGLFGSQVTDEGALRFWHGREIPKQGEESSGAEPKDAFGRRR